MIKGKDIEVRELEEKLQNTNQILQTTEFQLSQNQEAMAKLNLIIANQAEEINILQNSLEKE